MKAYPGFHLQKLDGLRASGTYMLIVANALKFGGIRDRSERLSRRRQLDIVTFGDLGFFARLQAMGALIKGPQLPPTSRHPRARRVQFKALPRSADGSGARPNLIATIGRFRWPSTSSCHEPPRGPAQLPGDVSACCCWVSPPPEPLPGRGAVDHLRPSEAKGSAPAG
jgi:hypothetical protein